MSAAAKGRTASVETRAKLSNSLKEAFKKPGMFKKLSACKLGVNKGRRKIEVSPGVFKKLKLEHVIEMKQQGLLSYIKIKDYFPNYLEETAE